MTGLELKNIVKGYAIKQRDLARIIGVSEQALTSYFRTTDVRQETLDKIDAAIRQLTNGQHGLVHDEPVELPAKDISLDTLAGMIKAVESELADIRIIRAELQQQLSRMNILENEREQRFASKMQKLEQFAQKLNLFGGVGSIALSDSDPAKDENPRPK